MAFKCQADELLQACADKHQLAIITRLELGDLGIEELNVKLLRQMEVLEEMDISNNKIKEIPTTLNHDLLIVLNLSNNMVESLEFANQFPKLEELDISMNLLTSIPSDLKLDRLKTLNCSGNCITSLTWRNLAGCPALVELDISRNKLTSMPTNIGLKKLKTLNCSENEFDSIEFVVQFTKLQDLNIECTRLAPCHRFIAADLCPTLTQIGKYNRDSLEIVTKSLRSMLEPQVAIVWKKFFSELYEDNIPEEDVEKVTRALISNVREATRKNISMLDVQNFMIKRVCQEKILQVQRGMHVLEEIGEDESEMAEDPPSSDDNTQERSPRTSKKRKAGDDEFASPRKRARPGQDGDGVKSPGKVIVVQKKSRGKKGTDDETGGGDSKSPTKLIMIKAPAKKSTVGKETDSPKPRNGQVGDAKSPAKSIEGKTTQTNINLPSMPDYEPAHFVRCHFGDKTAKQEGHADSDPTDDLTQVWNCAFEPDAEDSAKTTNVVATCGGDTVCLMDCVTGKVMKRFKQNKEQFFTLAWTTLTLDSGTRKWKSNILAVAGHNARHKLVHPDQQVCYAEWGDGRPNKSVTDYYTGCLQFHPKQKTWLFSGASDSTVTLWDIGVPSGPKYETRIVSLLILKTNHERIINVAYNQEFDVLVAASGNKFFMWEIGEKVSSKRHRSPYLEVNVTGKSETNVDGMTSLGGEVISFKRLQDPHLYVWKLSDALQTKADKGKVDIDPITMLQWKKTDVDAINMGSKPGVIACGDDKGGIWLYNMATFLKKTKYPTGQLLKASRILRWPVCVIDPSRKEEKKMSDVLEDQEQIAINCVSLSSNGEYVVSGTDSNLVCVWKKSSR